MGEEAKKLFVDAQAMLKKVGVSSGRRLNKMRCAGRCARLCDRGGRAAGYSRVPCLNNLTFDHASLSRRSTVPTPDRKHLRYFGAPYVFFHAFHVAYL